MHSAESDVSQDTIRYIIQEVRASAGCYPQNRLIASFPPLIRAALYPDMLTKVQGVFQDCIVGGGVSSSGYGVRLGTGYASI